MRLPAMSGMTSGTIGNVMTAALLSQIYECGETCTEIGNDCPLTMTTLTSTI